MKLWLLRRREDLQRPHPWDPWYDKAFGWVIRSETEEIARKLASQLCEDEGPQAWLSGDLSSCTELLPDGEEEIVIQDFRAA